jgi:signal transduction histidine kinase
LLFLCLSLFAQSPPDSLLLDLSKVQNAQSIGKYCRFATYKRNSVAARDIPFLKISQKIPHGFDAKIPIHVVENSFFLQFWLANNATEEQAFYFFPGLYCHRITLYKSASEGPPGNIAAISNAAEDSTTLPGYVFFTLKPGEKAQFFARLDFTQSTQSRLAPTIIRQDFVTYFKNNLLSHKITVNIFNYVTAGILLMMIIYSTSVYFQDYNIEFLYYSTYALCMGSLLFLKSYLYGSTNEFNNYFEGCLDFIIQMIGYSFYLLFIRKFLATKLDHPFLEKILAFSNWFIIIATGLFIFFYFFTNLSAIAYLVENIAKYGLLGFSVIFVLYGLWKKDPLMNYLVAGQLFLTFFSILSFILIISNYRFSKEQSSVLNDPLLYYQIGMILELVCFMSGLTYKNKRNLTERVKERERLKLENERKEFEKQVAILEAKQQERNRISADMHDELGSGVTAIRLMSEIVKTKMKENTLPEIEKISHSANELLSKMNTIIWTMVSSNDTVESLVAYIRAYAVEFFENTPIECRFMMPAYIPPIDLSGEKRRNIFLSVKEALNNVLKHSQGSVVMINITASDKLLIEIMDNGIGIDLDQLRKFGNGLNNMKKRIASISGKFSIENHQGTRTIFELDFE